MVSPELPSAGDQRARLAADLFAHMARSVVEHEPDPIRASDRLWRMPDVAAGYVFNLRTDAGHASVDPLVHDLRLAAADLIESRVDRAAFRRDLANRLRAATGLYAFRPWAPDDAEALARLLDSRRLWALLPESDPGRVTPELAADLIAVANGAPARHLVRAVLFGGHALGQVRLQFDSSPHADSAEISYWIGEEFWGRGIATDLVALFTSFAFQTRPELRRVFAQVVRGHVASIRVLEKSGYRREGVRRRAAVKSGHILDVEVFGVCRPTYVALADDPAAAVSSRRS